MANLLKLPQTITYWTPTGSNGTGGKTWATGVVINARISDVHEEFFDDEGKKIFANKAVYANSLIPIGSYIAETDRFNSASPTAAARQVIGVSSNPTMTPLNRMMLR